MGSSNPVPPSCSTLKRCRRKRRGIGIRVISILTAQITSLIAQSLPAPSGPLPVDQSQNLPLELQLSWRATDGELIANGGFESGNLEGWSTEVSGAGEFSVMNADSSTEATPIAGRYSAMTTSKGPSKRSISQQIDLMPAAESVQFSWTHKMENQAMDYLSPDQQFRVEIQDVSGIVLEEIFATQPGDPLLSDWQVQGADLTHHRGSTIRIVFVVEEQMGPMTAQLDNISLVVSAPAPSTFAVFFGTTPSLGPADLLTLTGQPNVAVSDLEILTTYYWQVVSHQGDQRSISPVWQFTTREPRGQGFKILNLGTTGCRVIEIRDLIRDNRGGIAVSESQVLVNGDDQTGRFEAGDLSGAAGLGRIYDALTSNLSTETIYSLAQGGRPIEGGQGTVDSLVQIDGATGALTDRVIELSKSVPANPGMGLFAGYDRIILHDQSSWQVYNIELPSGTVTILGSVEIPEFQGVESWASLWGIAEYFDETAYLVYVRNQVEIVRTRVSDGETTVVATFEHLGEMGSITVSLSQNRWYFQHEGDSQFFAGAEALGYCDAQFEATQLENDIAIDEAQVASPVLEGDLVSIQFSAINSGPKSAREVRVDLPLPDDATFVSAELSQGSYRHVDERLIFELGDLESDRVIRCKIVVIPTAAGELDFPISIGRKGIDSSLANNEVTLSTTAVAPQLELQGFSSITEADGTVEDWGTVSLSAPSSGPLAISLTSSDPRLATLTPELILPAFSTSAPIDLRVIDDTILNGARKLDLTASAIGFGSAMAAVTVLDDETPGPPSNPLPPNQATELPSTLTLSWNQSISPNGDFEAGDLSDWEIDGTGVGGWIINNGTALADGETEVQPPFGGRFSAVSQAGFDFGFHFGPFYLPGTHVLYQEAILPTEALSITLHWADLIRNHAGGFANPDHSFRVEIQSLEGELLEEVFSTQPGDPNFTQWIERSADLSHHRGQTIRLAFIQQDSRGPMNVCLDAVRLEIPRPADTVYDVFLGTNADLSPGHLLGTTPDSFWEMEQLEPGTTYFWQVIAHGELGSTVGPVWQFDVRDVGSFDHFAWDFIPGPEQVDRPFEITITAKDDLNNDIINFDETVELKAFERRHSVPVRILSFAAWADRTYPRTLEAIASHYSTFVETSTSTTDPAELREQLEETNVFLIVEQPHADENRLRDLGRSWSAVLNAFVATRGIVIVCDLAEASHGFLNESGLMTAELRNSYHFPDLVVSTQHPIVADAPNQFLFEGDILGYTSQDAETLMRPAFGDDGVVLVRQVGFGSVVLIGTNYESLGTPLDRVIANAVRLAESSTGAPISISPNQTTAFINGRWSGEVTFQEASTRTSLRARFEDGVGFSNIFEVTHPNDLSIEQIVAPRLVSVGEPLELKFSIHNSGPAPLNDVSFSLELPDGISLGSAEAPQGLCEIDALGIRCAIVELLPEEPAAITVELTPTRLGELGLIATVSLATSDPAPENNRIEIDIGVGIPTITVESLQVTEGDRINVVDVPVSLSPPSGQPVSVSYELHENSAKTITDFDANQGTITFAPRETKKSISVVIQGDSLNEHVESFDLILSNAVNAYMDDERAIVTILDDDNRPNVSIGDTMVTEGTGEARQAQLVVRLSEPSGKQVEVTYRLAGQPTMGGSDFEFPINGIVNFTPGETSKTIAFNVRADALPEEDETYTVLLENPVNADLGDSNGEIVILDDNVGPFIVTAGVRLTSESQAPANGLIDLGEEVSVDISLRNLGNQDAVDVMASLRAGDEVIPLGGAQSYGILKADGSSVSRSFSFGNNAFPGAILRASLRLRDGSQELGDREITFPTGPEFTFKIEELSAEGCVTVDLPTWARDEGGIAVSDDALYLSGITSGASYALPDLTGGAAVGVKFEVLTSNLRTSQVYSLGNDRTPIGFGGGIVTSLLEVKDGFLTGNLIPLSMEIPIGYDTGIFAGYDRIVLHHGERAFDIKLPTGEVGDLGIVPHFDHNRTGWAYWGVAEYFDDAIHLVYVQDNRRIQRRAISSRRSTTIGRFENLSAMPAIGVSIGMGQWYFRHRGTSQFGRHTLGTCQAQFSLQPEIVADDLSVLTHNSTQLVSPHDETAVKFTVLNPGPSVATGVTLNVTIPDLVNLISAEPSQGASRTTEHGIVADLGRIEGGQAAAVTVFLRMSEPADVELVAEVTQLEVDPVTDNNTSTVLLSVVNPQVNIGEITIEEGDRGALYAIFPATLDPPGLEPASVTYEATPGTADLDFDFLPTRGVISFEPGETEKEIVTLVQGDLKDENDESFSLELSDAVNASIGSIGRARIIDNDPEPSLSISDASVVEGDEGSQDLEFEITVTPPSGKRIRFEARVEDGTAIGGEDYLPFSARTRTIPAGTATTSVVVSVTGDAKIETDETLFIRLFANDGATIGDSEAVGTIVSDDHAPRVVAAGWRLVSESLEPADGFIDPGERVTLELGLRNTGSARSPHIVGRLLPGGGVTVPTSSQVYGELEADGSTVSQSFSFTAEGTDDLLLTPALQLSADGEDLGVVHYRLSLGPPGDFRIHELTTEDCQIIDHERITGDDQGGISISAESVFYTGDDATGRFGLDLESGTRLRHQYAVLISDLRTETPYQLGNGSEPIEEGGGTVTTLLEIDGSSGDLTGSQIALSEPITLGGGSGLFAGFGRVVFYDGIRVFEVELPSGVVTDHGELALTDFQYSETWAFWGVAEHFDNTVHLTYAHNDRQRIVRSTVGTGSVTTVGEFRDLSDMATFTVSVSKGRWYFKHEGGSQFGGNRETLGYCAAVFDLAKADDLELRLQAPEEINVGESLATTFTVINPGPSRSTGVLLTSVLPEDARFISATPTQGTCEVIDGILTCDLGHMAPASTHEIQLVLAPNEGTSSLSIDGTLTGDREDSFLGNNIVERTTRITLPRLTLEGTLVVEGNEGLTDASLEVTLSRVTSQTVTVPYVLSGSAHPEIDYLGTVEGELTFAPGETSKRISVQIIGDLLDENDETISARLRAPTNARLQGSRADLLIQDDDPMPTLLIADITVLEGEADPVEVEFSATLSEPSGRRVRVRYETEDRTAVTDEDFVRVRSRTLSFPIGETKRSFTIRILSDGITEPPEEFAINFFDVEGVSLSDRQSIVTIISEQAPLIVVDRVTLIDESLTPANGQIDTGETVTLEIGLRNVGTKPATNLTAALLEGGGVVGPSEEQEYGRLDEAATVSSRRFQFTIDDIDTPVLSMALQLHDNDTDLGILTYGLTIGPSSEFRIQSLPRSDCLTREHSEVTGDKRGGIAASERFLYYTGDTATGRFNLEDLSGGTSLGATFDALTSNLRTEIVYTLGTGATPLTFGGGTVTSLLEIREGILTGTQIPLSKPITVVEQTGVFSGYDRVVLHTNEQVYNIDLPSGEVTRLGSLDNFQHQYTESWAYWGVAEFFDQAVHLVYVESSQRIVRRRVTDGWVSTVAEFDNLDDTASIAVSLSQNRWYFKYEGNAEFGGINETIGYCDAELLSGGFSMLPELGITRLAEIVVLTWPANAIGFRVQSTDSLGTDRVWTELSAEPFEIDGLSVVTDYNDGGSRYYRLVHEPLH